MPGGCCPRTNSRILETVMESGKNLVEPRLWIDSVRSETINVDLTTLPASESERRRVIFMGRSSMDLFYLIPLCQTLSKVFDLKKSVQYLFSFAELCIQKT